MPQDVNYSEIYTLISILQVFSPAKVIFAGVGVLLLVRHSPHTSAQAVVTPMSVRRPRMFAQAKTLLLTFSSASKVFSDVSKSTPR